MREILFRGKRVDNGEWVQGFLTKRKFAGKEYFAIEQSERKIVTYDYEYVMQPYEIIPETVGQYTGLTDKNGKKIFEGDIVKAITSNIVGEDFEATVVVNLDNYELMCDIEHSHELEVIGNIHNNPELLEVQDDD